MNKVKSAYDGMLLTRFSQILRENLGVEYSQENWGELEKKLSAIVHSFGFKNPGECIEWLSRGKLNNHQIEVLAHYFTIGETYFFRDTNFFTALKENILPELLRKNSQTKKLRIWSAACCTGEEPYSIAILLDTLVPNLSGWDITILGTDINQAFLNKAIAGKYKDWSFRSTPDHIKKSYFHKESDGRFALVPKIRRMVAFKLLNLIENEYPAQSNNTSDMDLIICCNVLIYFNKEISAKVVKQLSDALVTEGSLFVSPIEVPFVSDTRLQQLRLKDVTFFVKSQAPKVLPKKQKDDLIEFKPFKWPERKTKVQRSTEKQEKRHPKSHPNLAEMIAKAKSLYEKGDYVRIVEILNEAAEKNPAVNSNDQAIELLAKSYANIGKLEEAKNWSQKLISLDGMDPFKHYFYSMILQEIGDDKQAEASLRTALFHDPNFIMAWFSLGSLKSSHGKKDEARKSLRNALNLLDKLPPSREVHGSDGLEAAQLRKIIADMLGDKSG